MSALILILTLLIAPALSGPLECFYLSSPHLYGTNSLNLAYLRPFCLETTCHSIPWPPSPAPPVDPTLTANAAPLCSSNLNAEPKTPCHGDSDCELGQACTFGLCVAVPLSSSSQHNAYLSSSVPCSDSLPPCPAHYHCYAS